jgi:hypothetical protein
MLDERREIAFVDQKARRGMLKNRREFVWSEPDVQRHHDSAGQQDAEIAFQELMRVEAEVSYAISFRDAFRKQAGREALATLAELCISKAVLSADNAGLPTVEIDRAVQASYWREGNVHDWDCTECG